MWCVGLWKRNLVIVSVTGYTGSTPLSGTQQYIKTQMSFDLFLVCISTKGASTSTLVWYCDGVWVHIYRRRVVFTLYTNHSTKQHFFFCKWRNIYHWISWGFASYHMHYDAWLFKITTYMFSVDYLFKR